MAVAADPVLSRVKLIAEPWDVGYGGWQTGRFPGGWVDWNDHYRDAVRSFWVADRAALDNGGQGASVARLADALSGSASLFEPSGRSRLASLNFITSHDGFTMTDLVSYDRKHNEANGEQNRDGHGDNRSYNHGFEGRTEDEGILARRDQSKRNLMASLMISLGVPMITAGDELGRTQQGNNNAYCQDNPAHLGRLDQHAGVPRHAAEHQARHPAPPGVPGRPAATTTPSATPARTCTGTTRAGSP